MLGAWKPKLDLPLYKDKPNQARTKRKSGLVMLFKGFVASLALYIVFNYLSSRSFLSEPTTWAGKQEQVREVFLELWEAYVEDAWGYDVYHPVTRSGENMGPKPLGWIIVDALDTLYIMGCDKEAAKAREWVKNTLDYKFDYAVNVFETTIRMLGGLLSAHHWSGNDDLYLEKATGLANQLLGAFSSDLGLPYASVNLLSGKGIKNHVDGGASSTAEVATLQLEFKYLAKLTGETLYWEKVEKIMQVLEANKAEAGLVPIYVNPDSGKFQGNLIRLGLRGDSYYEYLLKQYLQTDKKEPIYSEMYQESVNGVRTHLIGKSRPSGLTFVGELDQGIGHGLLTKMDHLVCFYGGLLALGATGGLTIEEAKKAKLWKDLLASDFKLAEELTETCYRMYHDVPATGLSPEIVVFNQDNTVSQDFTIKPRDTHNLQRPETVESLFILYRLTGDQKYRDWGWEIFQNFVKHTRVVGKDGRVSYTTLEDVTKTPAKKGDNMELFWLAETLKYLYLLFDDSNKVPLDQYVFNTEAHPFPVIDMNPLFLTGWSRLGHKVKSSKGGEPVKKVEEKKQEKPQKPQKVNAEKVGQKPEGSKSNDAKLADTKPKDAKVHETKPKEVKAEHIEVKADKIDPEQIDEKLAAELIEKVDSQQKKSAKENEVSDIELENEAKKDVPPPPPNVDKKHPPKAAPANKKIDEEVNEVAKEDPSVVE